MESAPVVVECRALIKSYGRTQALRGLDLEVRPGEVLGFLGPNGAGKSTTARALLALLRASSGTVRVLGREPWRDAVELHRRLADLQAGSHSLIDAHLRGAAWALAGGPLLLDVLGPSMKASDEVMSLSVFQHVPVIGAADQSSSGLVILGACALVLLGASFPAFRRRDIG